VGACGLFRALLKLPLLLLLAVLLVRPAKASRWARRLRCRSSGRTKGRERFSRILMSRIRGRPKGKPSIIVNNAMVAS
jgi:hypothetical protein